MLTLCFCLEDAPPVLRYSAYRPEIGDTVSLPELDGHPAPLQVIDVVGDGYDNPRVSIRVHPAQFKADSDIQSAGKTDSRRCHVG